MLKFVKIFGSVYFIFNLMIFVAIFILASFTSGKYLQFSPGWVFLLFPGIGMLSGYWIRAGRYGWGRSLAIAISFVCSVVFLFIAFAAGPTLDKLKADESANMQEMKKIELDIETERMFVGVYGGDIDIVKAQLAKGVDVNAINETKQTALHVTHNAAIARLIIEHGADIHAQDDLGSTPIFNKDIEIASILLDAGVAIDSRSEKGNTLLMFYTYSGYLEGIEFLVARGADVNACNSDKQNALDIAEHFQPNTDTWRYLQNLNLLDCP